MYFHAAVLFLFRHFINLRMANSPVSPRSICIEAASNIQSLVKSYQSLYTLRRIPIFVPYLILNAEIVRMMNLRWWHGSRLENQANDSRGCTDYLVDLARTHLFAQQAISLCDFIRECWEIENDDNADPITDYRSERAEGNKKFELALPHAKTFFRPGDEHLHHHEQIPSSNTRQTQSAPGLGFHPFRFQGDPLRKLLASFKEDTDKGAFEALRKELKARGFEIL